MSDKDKLAGYIKVRPKAFDPESILIYIDALDKRSIDNELSYDEAKDQVEEVKDFVVNEKITNESMPIGLAKVKATNDDRYKKVKEELSRRKKAHLYTKVEAKNAHTYCKALEQQSINKLAIMKIESKLH